MDREESEDDVVGFRAMEASLGKLTTFKGEISFNDAVKPKQTPKGVHHCFQGEGLQIVNGKKDCAKPILTLEFLLWDLDYHV